MKVIGIPIVVGFDTVMLWHYRKHWRDRLDLIGHIDFLGMHFCYSSGLVSKTTRVISSAIFGSIFMSAIRYTASLNPQFSLFFLEKSTKPDLNGPFFAQMIRKIIIVDVLKSNKSRKTPPFHRCPKSFHLNSRNCPCQLLCFYILLPISKKKETRCKGKEINHG